MKTYSYTLCIYAYDMYTYIRLQTYIYSWVEAGHNQQKLSHFVQRLTLKYQRSPRLNSPSDKVANFMKRALFWISKKITYT